MPKVTFVLPSGVEKTVEAQNGISLLEVAHVNSVFELEGACGGSLACSTCHLIVVDKNLFDTLPEASDEENDMLDLAFGVKETSRLGCQIIMSDSLDGLKVIIPASRNYSAS